MFLFLSIMVCAAPIADGASQPAVHEAKQRRSIQAEELKSWYDQNKQMVVLDARSKEYFDGTLLPQAKWVPCDASDDTINAAIPSKDSLVVVYCHGVTCPASGWLYDKLISLGYTNVYEYHEGIEGWQKRGYPTTRQS